MCRVSPNQVLQGTFLPSSGSILYAANPSSQLLFEMRGMNDVNMDTFNSLVDPLGKRRWAECVQLIAEEGIDPVFVGCKNKVLENNLLFIRESMADVLAWMFRERLLIDTECKSVSGLCKRMAERNPLGFPSAHLYEKVIKDFLFATFAGMTGSRPWDGEEQVNGGYIVVLPTGEVLCYHASDREQFREHLFRNTYIEYVSCKKYRWGFVEKDEQGRFLLPVNAAVRFFKSPVFTGDPTVRLDLQVRIRNDVQREAASD